MWSLFLVCLICFAVTLIPEFDKPQYRKARGIMYIALGLGSGILFIVLKAMDPSYVTYQKSWVYALGGYIYI